MTVQRSETPTFSRRSLLTPLLLFSCFSLLVGDLAFGFDTGNFGGILGNPGFIKEFGAYDPQEGTYAFSTFRTSLSTSLALIGKFIGCLIAGPAIEKFGHRVVFFVLCAVAFIGIILEISSASSSSTPGTGRLSQFIVGRIVVYTSVGLVEVCVPTYQAEIVPANIRGLVVVSLQLFLTVGTLIASGANLAYKTDETSNGWQTVTGIQFLFPFLLLICAFFIPSSPRWLLSRSRDEEAIKSLRRLRPQSYADEGWCEVEVQAIQEALHQETKKAPWSDLFRGNNMRRTIIVMGFYFFHDATGQPLAATYATTFFQDIGFGSKSYTFVLIGAFLSILSVIPAMVVVDKLGRRKTLLISYFFQAAWMYILAGVGTAGTTTASKNTVVASLILYAVSYNMGSASIPYLLGAEIPTAGLREKTQALGAAWNVIWAFVVSFVTPYLIDSISFKIGILYGSISVVAVLFTFFFLPETKGFALEEVDAIFENSFNPFHPSKPNFTAAELRVGELEGATNDGNEEKTAMHS
ncbi:putative sugar transporter [Xylariaceae sp. FL1019]|nr:putative sugar transporter [Xylariaceae sp. FL1019]